MVTNGQQFDAQKTRESLNLLHHYHRTWFVFTFCIHNLLNLKHKARQIWLTMCYSKNDPCCNLQFASPWRPTELVFTPACTRISACSRHRRIQASSFAVWTSTISALKRKDKTSPG